MKTLHEKQFSSYQTANRAIKNQVKKYGQQLVNAQKYSINQLDAGCFEILSGG